MKKLLNIIIVFFLALGISAEGFGEDFPLPEPSNEFYVYDEANVIDSQLESDIIRINRSLSEATGAQIVIAVVDTIEGATGVEEYANELFEKWQIGDSEEDNGILFLTTVEEREMYIEIGYGLEGAITDGRAGEIRDDYIIPYFQEDNFNDGIENGFYALVEEVKTEYNIENLESAEPVAGNESSEANPILRIIGIIVILIIVFVDITFFGGTFTFFILATLLRGRGGGGFGGGSGGSRGGGGSSGGGGAGGGF